MFMLGKPYKEVAQTCLGRTDQYLTSSFFKSNLYSLPLQAPNLLQALQSDV